MGIIEKLSHAWGKENHLKPLEGSSDILELSRRSALPKTDLEWVVDTISANPTNGPLVDNILSFLRQADTERVRRKIAERKLAQPVDLMKLISPFSEKEIANLARHMNAIQLTDGCTVGCPWCGLCAKRGIEKKFSFNSLQTFAKKFGKNMQSPPFTIFYHASDPFDWVDNEITYLDLVKTVARNNVNLKLYTSTAVPEGSEFAILRYLDSYSQFWQSSKAEGGAPPLRFSKTQFNAQRVEQILAVLRAKGVTENFLNELSIFERNEGNITLTGYFIKHPQRKLALHTRGISCADGLYLTLDKGFVTIYMEAATLQNPTGWHEEILAPVRQELPLYLHESVYRFTYDDLQKRKAEIPFLPEVKYEIFKKGKLVSTETRSSLRREVLAFDLATDQLIQRLGGNQGLPPPAELEQMADPLQRFTNEYKRRGEKCLKLLSSETDEEIRFAAQNYLALIYKWLAKAGTVPPHSNLP